MKVPEGFTTDIIAVREAPSMAAGYNAAMNSCDAKYKVYLHQDVFILNQNFLVDMLVVFESDKKIGMLGMIGGVELPESGIIYNAWNCGRTITAGDKTAQDVFFMQEEPYMYVESLDGMLMATQYDIQWREDILKSWHYYDVSQSFEFRRVGYKLAIPFQKNAWTIHDCGYSKLDGYDINRKIMFDEYPEFLKGEYEKCPLIYSEELAVLERNLYIQIKELIDFGRIDAAKVVLDNVEGIEKDSKMLILQHIKWIGKMEKDCLGSEFIWMKGFNTEGLLMRATYIKFMLRRILVEESITLLEIYQWISVSEISVIELLRSIQSNIVDRERAIAIFIQVYNKVNDKQSEMILKKLGKVLKQERVIDGIESIKKIQMN